MFEIRNVATSGFDRAIIAMRREHGGREASDSDWWSTCDLCDYGGKEFIIGPDDKAECLRLIKAGDRPFMKYIVAWAHVEAPAQWWAVYGGYFIAQSDVRRSGDMLTRSVMTTYGNLLNLLEVVSKNENEWKMQAELCKALEALPESWLILEELEA